MKDKNLYKKSKINKLKILSLVCLGLLLMGIFISVNINKESSIVTNITNKTKLAGEIVTPQTWGGCEWKIESSGKLFIYASSATNGYAAGEMGDITNTTSAPWYQYRDQIKTVQVGQTAEYNATPVKVKTNNKIGGMFRDCTNLTSVNFVNINFSNATTMWYMFYNCKSLRTITGFEKIKATKAKSFEYMFDGCSSLQTLNIGPNFSTTALTDVSSMFHSCTSLTTINGFGNLETSAVEDMSYMFHSCTSLTNIDGFENLKTSSVTNMAYMFYNCASLNNLVFGDNFNTKSVTNMSFMFCNCSSLRELDLTNFNTKEVTNTKKMLYQTGLRTLNINGENFVSTKMIEMEQMFPTYLQEITIGHFDFKLEQIGPSGVNPYPWGRGTWEKFVYEGGELVSKGLYPAVQVCKDSSSMDISGTYRKVSNISNVFNFDSTVTYSITDFFSIDKTTCEVSGNIDAGIDKRPRDNPADSRIYVYLDNIPLTNQNGKFSFDSNEFIKIKIEDAVYDANNNKYDFEIKINNIDIDGLTTLENSSGTTFTKATLLPLRIAPTNISVNNTLYDNHTDLNSLSPDDTGRDFSFDITITIRNKNGDAVDGNYMFSAYDIDIKDKVVTGGDVAWLYDTNYSEGINLLSGFDTDNIYTTPPSIGTWVEKVNKGSYIRLRGKNSDNGTELTEFLVPTNASGATFSWTAGSGCGTSLISTYQPKNITIKKVDEFGNRMENAVLKLTGTGIDEEWTTDSSDRSFFLNPGQYKLEELTSPTGYEKADDIIFWVDGENTLTSLNQNVIENSNTIVMTDSRANYNYTIEYYYDNVKDDDKTETGSALYQSSIDSYPDKNITGYKFDKHENFPLTIGTNPDNNVIKVYYVKDNFDYSIEYYYDNVKDDDKTETGSALYQSSIDSYPDKNITGYKFDKHENFPLSIGTNPNDNIIKVYYVKDSFGYTIEYYYDNVKDNEKTESGAALYQSSIDSYPDKNITGYKFDKHENFPLSIGANPDDNIIKVYYVKDSFGYTIEYYYDNVKDNEKTESGAALYQNIIDSYPDKNITGYKFDKHENFPLSIGANPDDNIIKVYYVKDNFNYTIEYYYDNVKDNSKTETGSALYQSTIDSYTDKNKTGYRFDRHENIPLTISANSANNVIKVYYVKDNFNYTVEYYYDNVKDDSKTETQSATYQSLIDSYIDKNMAGYKFEKTENFPLTITENAANNVIKIYYIIDDGNTKTLTYTVEYYKDNVKVNSDTITRSITVQVLEPDTLELDRSLIEDNNKYVGYKLERTDPTNVPNLVNNGDIIKVYYVKDNFNYTVEYYYDNVKDNAKTETSSALYQSTITTYTDKNITGYKFDKTENLPLTISANTSNNVIKVYYVKDNYNYTIEYYYDNVKDNSKTETGFALYQSSIDSYPGKNITGYKFDKHENFPLTISANTANNVIKVYYVKDNFNYTIEYYYDNVRDNAKTETGSALYQSIVDSYTDKNKTGYKFDKHENFPLTISANSANNVIKVYYVKDSFNYTVEYYYDNVKDDSKTETGSALYQSIVDSYTDKNKTGYKFDKHENFPLTIGTNPTNNVIKVYYVKDSFNYSIEYYYDNVKDDDKTETGSALYQSSIDSYPDKNIIGYKFDKHENFPLTIGTNPDENIIKVYYVKDSFGYTIEYYYDNVKDDTKTEAGAALYQSTINNYPDKNITGYRWDKHENIPLTITENAANNVIKVYYVLDDGNTKTLSYTVEYYKDNEKVEGDTETRIRTAQILEPDTLDLDRSLINDDNKYVGYKLEKTIPTNVPDVVNNGDVIKVYYIKDTFNYTIEYYYDNEKDDDKTETGSALYQSSIDSYPDKNITGYKFDKHENFPLTITENTDNNVIKVYYVKDNFNYTIEYYYDNVKDDSKTETGSALYQSTIENYTDKNITGYKFDKHENIPLTISANASNNVIKVYYVKDSFNYIIEYYYDNVKDDTKTETGTAEYQSTINNYTDKNITGYKFDRTEGLPLTISENSANNVIKVYYIKDSFTYSVEYYYDNVKDNTKTETGTAEYQSTIENYTDKNKTGYKFDKTEGLPLTISENPANNVIKVYYIKDSFGYTVEYYYDNVKDDTKTETGTAEYQSIVRNYTDKNITGYRFDKTENCPLTITENADSNVIKVYYVIDDGNTTTISYRVEYYKDNEKVEGDTETRTKTIQILDP